MTNQKQDVSYGRGKKQKPRSAVPALRLKELQRALWKLHPGLRHLKTHQQGRQVAKAQEEPSRQLTCAQSVHRNAQGQEGAG